MCVCRITRRTSKHPLEQQSDQRLVNVPPGYIDMHMCAAWALFRE